MVRGTAEDTLEICVVPGKIEYMRLFGEPLLKNMTLRVVYPHFTHHIITV